MGNRTISLLLANVLVFNLGLGLLIYKHQTNEPEVIIQRRVVPEYTPAPIERQPEPPARVNPSISTAVPAFLNYAKTVEQLKKWNTEAPTLTEVGIYGKSKNGLDLYYIRIHNNATYLNKPKVLITACIHGNEPLSASTVMGYIGTLLDKYGEDEEITRLVDTRDIYFTPVISPDSYPGSRHVNGVDPNRDFPTERDPGKISVPPVRAIQELVLKHKFNAIISGHTSGRVYLTPWGDNTQPCPNEADYQRIMKKMGEMSQYRVIRACQMYNRPIFGTEVDWYYRQGAFAIVMEFGTHQQVPSQGDIKTEFDKTFKAVLWFIEEAPKVEIKKAGRRRAA